MCIGMANGGKISKEVTPQEAIEELKIILPYHKGSSTEKIYKLAINALEKQIPKKPIEDVSKDYEGNIIDDVFFCPKCTRTICFGCETDIKENYPYCNCGQKIDWSDTE